MNSPTNKANQNQYISGTYQLTQTVDKMRFSFAIALAFLSGLAVAKNATELEALVTDPTNPQNLINCPPGGGADGCHLETRCDRIRINYGYSFNGHSGSCRYNYNINSVPDGKRIEIDNQGTC